jgi:hypothetical protein
MTSVTWRVMMGLPTIRACGHPDIESEQRMADFTGRGVLVTGADGGIGRLPSAGSSVDARQSMQAAETLSS